MTITLDTFKQDRFRGEFPKLPICLLLASTHLFVKEDSLKLCGWVDKSVFAKIEEVKVERVKAKGKKVTPITASAETVTGVATIHTFNDKNEEGGLSFPNPRIHILASSPRLVEVTENGMKAHLGRKGAIIGNYEFAEGAELHHKHDRELNLTTLRTLHMIYLVGADNQPLHKVPLVLSTHGGAAAIFGTQLEMYYKLLEIALTENFGDGYYTLNEEARASAIFQPTFGLESVGTDKTSDVCAVENFVEPTPQTVEQHLNLQNAEMLWNTRKSLGNFASRYMQQFEKFHAITPGIELDEFPQAKELPTSEQLLSDEYIPDLYKDTKQKDKNISTALDDW